jgi:hypothetical protein
MMLSAVRDFVDAVERSSSRLCLEAVEWRQQQRQRRGWRQQQQQRRQTAAAAAAE